MPNGLKNTVLINSVLALSSKMFLTVWPCFVDGVSLGVFSGCWGQRTFRGRASTGTVAPLCGCSCGSSNSTTGRIFYHRWCSHMAFLQYGFSYEIPNLLEQETFSHRNYRHNPSSWDFLGPDLDLGADTVETPGLTGVLLASDLTPDFGWTHLTDQ